uniref:(northern house mosquito) hypothetical protein n=1 Tax=Culex pipiens TaxID=7175 RepID=A0A8D8PIQ6_CULPI
MRLNGRSKVVIVKNRRRLDSKPPKVVAFRFRRMLSLKLSRDSNSSNSRRRAHAQINRFHSDSKRQKVAELPFRKKLWQKLNRGSSSLSSKPKVRHRRKLEKIPL